MKNEKNENTLLKTDPQIFRMDTFCQVEKKTLTSALGEKASYPLICCIIILSYDYRSKNQIDIKFLRDFSWFDQVSKEVFQPFSNDCIFVVLNLPALF